MPKILHSADVHLGSQLSGLVRYEGAPEIDVAAATRRAFERLVNVAIEEEVDLVLLAGDVFDGDWPDYNTGLHFLKQLGRLRDAKIPVVMIRGNHDAANVMTKQLNLKDLCELLPHNKAGSAEFSDIGVVVHGQSYAKRAVKENLVLHYPPRVEGFFNIGLLHTALEGREGHEPYAPCTLADLDSLEYDYWALGHVHTRDVLKTPRGTPAVFPGNTQGRHCNEPGPKGVYILDIDGKAVRLRFVPTHQVEWRVVEVDLGGADNRDAVLDRLGDALEELADELPADPEVFAIRLELVGETPLDVELRGDEDWLLGEARRAAVLGGGQRIWVEGVRVRTGLPGHAEQTMLEPHIWDALRDAAKELDLDQLLQDQDLRKLLRQVPQLKADTDELVRDDRLRQDALAYVLRRLKGS